MPLRACRLASVWLVVCAPLANAAAAAAPGSQRSGSQHSGSQHSGSGVLDLQEQEAVLERAWTVALALDDSDEPMRRMAAFESIAMQELIVDRVRSRAQGTDVPDPEDSRQRMLARWRRARPTDPGPDVFATLSIRDPAERLAPTLALVARHPDDVLVLWVAKDLLRSLDQGAKAGELLEGFLRRHPDHPQAYLMLIDHYDSQQHETRKTDLIERWAQREPLDPRVVSLWVRSSLTAQEPEASAALVDRFFATQPRSPSALPACTEIAQLLPDYLGAARACLARIAVGGDGSPAAKRAAELAGAQLFAMAVRGGDWQGLLTSLGSLPPAERQRALLSALHEVPVPGQCATLVELVRVAGELDPGDEGERRRLAGSIVSALTPCAEQPAARALYLEVLRTAVDPEQVVTSWTTRIHLPGGGMRRGGALPAADAARILERRLAESPAPELASSLFRALDLAYQVAGDGAAHYQLLRRWQRQQPDQLAGEQTVALARYLLADGKLAQASELLQQRAQLEPSLEIYGLWWEIQHRSGRPEEAERIVADLLAGDDSRAAMGHLLSGRGALLKGDLAAAERGYTAYLLRSPSVNVAGELVAAMSRAQGSAAGVAVATRLCAATSFPEAARQPAACASALATAGGEAAAAATLLAQQAVEQPNDLATLRDLAWKAQAAEQWEIAELTRRRLVALDPKTVAEWTHLGVVLEKRGKTAELEALIGEARSAFQRPPVELLRAAARAWTAAGDARRAAALLEEARAAMPAGSELGWIDAELRQAYVAAGRWENPYATPLGEERLAELQRAAEAGDLGAASDLAVELLRDQRQGERCERGIAMLERAAAAGHRRSAGHLGSLLYYNGAPCPEAAPIAARGWLRRAVDDSTRSPGPLVNLGLLLLLGEGGEPAPAEGVALLERAAVYPLLLAVEISGLVYAGGLGVPRDVEKARSYFREADRQGSDSLQTLSERTRWRPVAELVRRAVERLQALASEGDPSASGLLARLHQVGHLVPYDAERAVTLARAAAARGDATAMRVLFHAYLEGNGVARDAGESLGWLRRGAEAGNSYCMMFLSQRLMKGDDEPRDVPQGLAWLERAVQVGNRWALTSLARLHAEGRPGLPRDPAKAIPWMKLLAGQGDFEARGWLVLHGHPVEQAVKDVE